MPTFKVPVYEYTEPDGTVSKTFGKEENGVIVAAPVPFAGTCDLSDDGQWYIFTARETNLESRNGRRCSQFKAHKDSWLGKANKAQSDHSAAQAKAAAAENGKGPMHADTILAKLEAANTEQALNHAFGKFSYWEAAQGEVEEIDANFKAHGVPHKGWEEV